MIVLYNTSFGFLSCSLLGILKIFLSQNFWLPRLWTYLLLFLPAILIIISLLLILN